MDGSDEKYCGDLLCPAAQLPCTDGKMCYDQIKWYDGVEDCIDASDEQLQPQEIYPGYEC